MECAKFSKVNPNEIDFTNKNIFLYESSKKYTLVYAKELVLGKEYGNVNGDLIAKSTGKHCLFSGYKNHYSDEELSIFIKFILDCGAMSSLVIEERGAESHPEFNKSLNTGGQWTDYGISIDYTIDGLEEMLKNITLQKSLMIWETLLSYGKKCSDWEARQNYYYSRSVYPAYQVARYKSNNSHALKYTDSSLIFYLKNTKWLYDINGRIHKPEDILIDKLSSEYEYVSNNPLIKALKIGSLITAEAKERRKFEDELKKEGKTIIDTDEYDEFLKFKEKQNKKNGPKKITTIEEGINSGNKDNEYDNEEDGYEDENENTGAVQNAEKRGTNIINTFSGEMSCDENLKIRFSTVYPSNEKEKAKLREWYKGRCQICGEKIVKYDHEPHFIAKNIMSSSLLPDSFRNTEYLCWNSLSLCPNCAAKYNYCQKDMSNFLEQVLNTEVETDDESPIKVDITLAGNCSQITFDPRHFFDMQTVFKEFDALAEKNANSNKATTINTDCNEKLPDSTTNLQDVETKVNNQPRYLMFKWLEQKTKNCPRDGGTLERKYVSVQKKDGTVKKLPMLSCSKCRKLFMVREELSNTIRLSDYYISDGTYAPKQEPKTEVANTRKQVRYIFQTSKKGLELNHIYEVIDEDEDYYVLDGIEGKSMKKCFVTVN